MRSTVETTPDKIASYHILRRLGHGSMGVVYLAQQEEDGKQVALKQITRAEESQLLRFKREFRAMKRLDHPDLVTVFDYGQSGPYPFFSMEFVDGVDLRTYVWYGGPENANPGVDPTAADFVPDTQQIQRMLRVFALVCRPLSYIHGERIVHRDLKPTNVLVLPSSWEDDSEAIKLMDFSLVKDRYPESSLDLEITQAGALVGTPAYMSPEQVVGEEVDARADLYSLGVMMYELVVGERPFDGASTLMTAMKHLNEPATPPHERNSRVPKNVSELIQKLLEKEPDDRIQSARSLHQRLVSILSGSEAEVGAIAGADSSLHEDLSRTDDKAESETDKYAFAPFIPQFVGRKPEWSELQMVADDLVEGQGRFVIVSGEAGVGKTRLAREFRALLKGRGVRVFAGACMEGAQHPLGVFNRALDGGLRKATPLQKQALSDALGPMLKVLGGYFPPISRLPGYADADEPVSLPPDAAKFRLLEGILDVLRWTSGLSPMALFLDNLQWADPLTVEAIEYITRRGTQPETKELDSPAEPLPLLLMTCVRTEEMADHERLHQMVSRLRSVGAIQEIELGRLTEDQTEAVLSSMLGGDDFPPAFGRRLHRESEGNPLYIEEIVKELVAEEIIVRRADGRWELASASSAAELTASDFDRINIPETIREVVSRRIDRLSPELVRILQLAAVIGPEFSFEILHRVSGWDENRLLDAMDALLRRDVLVELPSQARYRFHHDKVREVVYESTSATRRRRVHGRVADALREQDDRDLSDIYPELAHHCLRADRTADAYTYSMAAARQAQKQFANDQSFQLLTQALDAIGGAPSDDYREEFVQAKIERGEVLKLVGRYARSREDFADALEASRDELGGEHSVDALLGICECYWWQGAYQVAREFGKEALDAAKRQDSPRRQSEALMSIAPIHFYLAQVDKAEAMLQEALDILRGLNDDAGVSEVLGRLGTAAQQRGDYDKANEYYAESTRIAERQNLQTRLATNYTNVASMLYERGRFGEALDRCRDAIELNKQIGNRAGLALSLSHLGEIHAHVGMYERGMESLQRSVAISEETGERVFLPNTLIMMARLFRALGDEKMADRTLDRARRLSEDSNAPEDRVEVELEAARFKASRGKVLQALETVRSLMPKSERLSTPRVQAETLHLLGRLLLLSGNLEAAHSTASKAYRLRRSHDLAKVWSSLGLLAEICEKMGQRSTAREHASRAVQLLFDEADEVEGEVREAFLNRRGVTQLIELHKELADS